MFLKLILWFNIKCMDVYCMQAWKFIQNCLSNAIRNKQEHFRFNINFQHNFSHKIVRWDDGYVTLMERQKHHPWFEELTVGTTFSLWISCFTCHIIKLLKLTLKVSLHIFVHKLFKLQQINATMKGRTLNNIFTVSISTSSNPVWFCCLPSMEITKI